MTEKTGAQQRRAAQRARKLEDDARQAKWQAEQIALREARQAEAARVAAILARRQKSSKADLIEEIEALEARILELTEEKSDLEKDVENHAKGERATYAAYEAAIEAADVAEEGLRALLAQHHPDPASESLDVFNARLALHDVVALLDGIDHPCRPD